MTLMQLTAAIALLVAAAPLLTLLLGRAAGWVLAAGLLAIAGGMAALRAGSGDVHESVPWIPAIDVALRLRLDGLSYLFALVILVIGAFVLVYSTSYLTERRPTGFYTLMTAFAAAMLVLVLADDLVVMFVAWELTTLCSYLLIARSGPNAGPAATRTLLVTVAGGLCLLGAVALTVVRTGTTEITEALRHEVWANDPAFCATVAVLVALAAMTKSAQFPFHAWLPDAMVAPAPVSAYLHAAAMVKAGIYLLMLFAPATANSSVWPILLVTVGLLTAVMGALFALQRNDLKELLAYSTVSQLGLLVVVIGIGTPAAMLAASLHIVAHALFKSAAFMHVGLLERRAGSRDVTELSGLARSMPWDAAMICLAALSMAGIAPAVGFVSKELVFDALLGAPGGQVVGWVVALVAASGAALTVAYSVRMIVTTLPGPVTTVRRAREAVAMSVAISVTALGGLVAGLAVWLLDDLARSSAAVAAGTATNDLPGLYLWHGVNAPLVLSAIAIVVGVALALRRTWVSGLVGRSLFPGSGVAATQWAMDETMAGGRRVGNLTRADAPAAHLAAPVIVIGVGVLGVASLWPGWPETIQTEPIDVGLLVVLGLGVVTLIRAQFRLTAVIAVGVTGFSVALWFFVLGASDVALTQLLVEILTVVIMVLVLQRLRPRFAPAGLKRTLPAGLAAVGAGIAATVATLAFTGHRSLSDAGEYFLAEAENETGGTNVVNTILVDFRALDTLGELVVLAICAVSVTALLNARRPLGLSAGRVVRTPLSDPLSNSVFLAVLDRALFPLMLLGSIYALLRGHNAPGGGFIAALVGASAIALAYLAASSDDPPRLNQPFLAIAGSGIAVATGSGLLGFAEGAFLRPLHAEVFGVHLSSALIFDAGVYLAVFGVILAAINLLGTSSHDADVEAGSSTRDRRPVERAEATR